MQPSNPKEQHPDETLWFRLEGLIKGSGLDVLGFQGAPLSTWPHATHLCRYFARLAWAGSCFTGATIQLNTLNMKP